MRPYQEFAWISSPSTVYTRGPGLANLEGLARCVSTCLRLRRALPPAWNCPPPQTLATWQIPSHSLKPCFEKKKQKTLLWHHLHKTLASPSGQNASLSPLYIKKKSFITENFLEDTKAEFLCTTFARGCTLSSPPVLHGPARRPSLRLLFRATHGTWHIADKWVSDGTEMSRYNAPILQMRKPRPPAHQSQCSLLF